MKTKLLGIILSILGITGLILSLLNVNTAASNQHVILVFAGGIFEAALFFIGISLIPNPHKPDKTVKVPVNSLP